MQVTALALCKHSKNNMLVCKMSKYWRHARADQLFHTYSQIPAEALEVHAVGLPHFYCVFLLFLITTTIFHLEQG